MVLPASLSKSLGVTTSAPASKTSSGLGIAQVTNTDKVLLSAPAALPSGKTSATVQQALGAYQTPSREEQTKAPALQLPAQEQAAQERAQDAPPSPSQKSSVFFQSKKLGAGAFGKVYRLTHNNKQIAFKVPTNNAARDDLVKEMSIYLFVQQQLGDHPNFIHCDGMQMIDGIEGLALDFVEGKSLGALLDSADECYHNHTLSHSEYWGVMQFLMSETIQALKTLESIGVAHLDVKLENILYDPKAKTIKIIDFGNAGFIGKDPVKAGTLLTASPEAIAASISAQPTTTLVDKKQDSFSIGKIVFRIGEGEHNYMGLDEDSRNHQSFISRLMSIYRNTEQAENYRSLEPVDFGNLGPTQRPYESQYIKFVNDATRFDPEKRLSLNDLSEYAFIKDPLLNPEDAPAAIEKITKWQLSQDTASGQ
ncbi:MAG: protein kinase domain-containing protein [Vibrionaceae bacterium]